MLGRHHLRRTLRRHLRRTRRRALHRARPQCARPRCEGRRCEGEADKGVATRGRRRGLARDEVSEVDGPERGGACGRYGDVALRVRNWSGEVLMEVK